MNGYQPNISIDTSNPPGGGSGVKRSPLNVTVEIKDLEIFKELVKCFAFLFEKADQDTKLQVLDMLKHGHLITVTRSKES